MEINRRLNRLMISDLKIGKINWSIDRLPYYQNLNVGCLLKIFVEPYLTLY